MFGAYGIGLFGGFFGYFLFLCVLVCISKNFNIDFFLDGRRKRLANDEYIPGDSEPGGGQHPVVSDPGRERQTVIVIPPEAIKIQRFAMPDTAYVSHALGTADVTQTCKDVWDDNKTDCNAFVKAVASKFNITLTGQADDILGQIKGADWTSHEHDGIAASEAAKTGRLVIGGMNSKDLGQTHGHVVVVVPPTGPLGHGRYPYAYWGSTNVDIRADGGVGTTINYSFDTAHRDNVFYASKEI
ncbi:Uncharacterised protein [Burkholderia pseudomallei]|nr:Uncharacterised protein [Burkholderia pseudomallei]CAJ6204205.1 Uncharacterised protein [Burkholderia pseudomallei]CAJ7032836.1 Uncharacterised protein [Burkholderia pseudomallei]CAJ7890782.1 Uncharacterised protein [Burkholderia pseudomallei]VBF60510.1 Uncharacterised protein [Burkholderia pseudomallei]